MSRAPIACQVERIGARPSAERKVSEQGQKEARSCRTGQIEAKETQKIRGKVTFSQGRGGTLYLQENRP